MVYNSLKTMKLNYYFASFVILIVSLVIYSVHSYSIEKHAWQLYFPQNTILQFTVAFSLVIETPPRYSGKVFQNWGVQCNYDLPYNYSFYAHPPFWAQRSVSGVDEVIGYRGIGETSEESKKRVKKDLNSAEFYEFAYQLMPTLGYHNSCILKSICEHAKTPLHLDDHSDGDGDILHEILHFMLSPSLHDDINYDHKNETSIFQHAEHIGKSNMDCDQEYYKCLKSPLEKYTHLIMDDD